MPFLTLGNPELKRLSVSMDYPIRVNFTSSAFQSLTHLEIRTDYFLSPQNWVQIRQLANLTHLALKLPLSETIPAFANIILPHLPASVRTWVLHGFSPADITEITISWLISECDPRLVLCLFKPLPEGSATLQDFVVFGRHPNSKYWGHLPKGELDIWEMAENIQAKRERIASGNA